MEIINFGDSIKENSAVAIGTFDGVHLGHQKLLAKIREASYGKGLVPIAYTFSTHPIKENQRRFITTLEERLYLLEKFGMKYAYLANLDESFMQLSPEEFIERELVNKLNVKFIAVGKNFRFGYQKKGDCNTLLNLSKKFSYEVNVIEPVSIDGKLISSSLIHNLIKEGLIEEAIIFLGHTYFLQGTVNKGKGLGRKLGFPTVNVDYQNNNKLLPKIGVYITASEVAGHLYESITDVGFNPTFENDKKIHIESHFMGIDGDFYGEFVRIHFLKRIRDEVKFNSAEALINQLINDVETAENFFKTNPLEVFQAII